MAAPTRNILIFGATGLIGEHITTAVIAAAGPSFKRITVFTSPNTAATKRAKIERLKEQGVLVTIGDITSESDVCEAYNGIDTVISCLGRPVIHQQILLIRLAERHADVKRFFPSEYGTDIEYRPDSANEKPHQQKLKVRALLKGVKDLDYTYVVTGPYADANGLFLDGKHPERETEGSFDVTRKRAVLLGDGNGRISMTTMRDVGRLVVGALLHPDAVRNRAIHVNSFTATPHQILAEFEKQTGGDRWSVSYTSLDQLKRLEEQLWADGAPQAGGVTLRRIWTSGGTLYDERDNGLIGMEDSVEDLETAVRRACAEQRLAASKG